MARDADDEFTRSPPLVGLTGRDLGPMSVDELLAYIVALEQEISRVRNDIAA